MGVNKRTQKRSARGMPLAEYEHRRSEQEAIQKNGRAQFESGENENRETIEDDELTFFSRIQQHEASDRIDVVKKEKARLEQERIEQERRAQAMIVAAEELRTKSLAAAAEKKSIPPQQPTTSKVSRATLLRRERSELQKQNRQNTNAPTPTASTVATALFVGKKSPQSSRKTEPDDGFVVVQKSPRKQAGVFPTPQDTNVAPETKVAPAQSGWRFW